MNNETWKEINGFSNYEISSNGNIKNKENQKLLKVAVKSGYLSISLTDRNFTRHSLKIHRLVALTFIPNPEKKETVNHIII